MAGVTVRIAARVMVGKVIGVVMVVNMAMAAVRKGVCMRLRAGSPVSSVGSGASSVIEVTFRLTVSRIFRRAS